jgi:hypothetical protein
MIYRQPGSVSGETGSNNQFNLLNIFYCVLYKKIDSPPFRIIALFSNKGHKMNVRHLEKLVTMKTLMIIILIATMGFVVSAQNPGNKPIYSHAHPFLGQRSPMGPGPSHCHPFLGKRTPDIAEPGYERVYAYKGNMSPDAPQPGQPGASAITGQYPPESRVPLPPIYWWEKFKQ